MNIHIWEVSSRLVAGTKKTAQYTTRSKEERTTLETLTERSGKIRQGETGIFDKGHENDAQRANEVSYLKGPQGNAQKRLGTFSEQCTHGPVLFFFKERVICIRKRFLFQ